MEDRLAKEAPYVQARSPGPPYARVMMELLLHCRSREQHNHGPILRGFHHTDILAVLLTVIEMFYRYPR